MAQDYTEKLAVILLFSSNFSVLSTINLLISSVTQEYQKAVAERTKQEMAAKQIEYQAVRKISSPPFIKLNLISIQI